MKQPLSKLCIKKGFAFYSFANYKY
uniref:Uncharacterized protein n=1 Tax=Anguilla anguilla TaxID=7936 RepID=A0A0E9SN20_ANGAN